jgi:hypothetical protein
MAILNLYFMQGSIKECVVASEQDRKLLCTLQPSQIVTMLLSMLTSAALFKYAASCTVRFDFARCTFSWLHNSYKISHVSHIKSIWHEKQELNLQRKTIFSTRQSCTAEVMSQP